MECVCAYEQTAVCLSFTDAYTFARISMCQQTRSQPLLFQDFYNWKEAVSRINAPTEHLVGQLFNGIIITRLLDRHYLAFSLSLSLYFSFFFIASLLLFCSHHQCPHVLPLSSSFLRAFCSSALSFCFPLIYGHSLYFSIFLYLLFLLILFLRLLLWLNHSFSVLL